MKRVLKIKYNGADFAGYQFQPDKRTVQGTLTSSLSKALGFEVKVTGCSRTDAGVHAEGFVCTVEPKNDCDTIDIPVGKLHRAARRFLPCDIGIAGESIDGDDFHPRYSVVRKTYEYKMYDSPAYDPFLASLAWQLKKPLPENGIDVMNSCGKALVGRHDFTSFMAAGSRITDAVREIYSLSVRRERDMTVLSVTADGFLYNMVRIIAGTLIRVGGGYYPPKHVKEILEAKNRELAGETARPEGLTLVEIRYPEWEAKKDVHHVSVDPLP